MITTHGVVQDYFTAVKKNCKDVWGWDFTQEQQGILWTAMVNEFKVVREQMILKEEVIGLLDNSKIWI